MADEALRGAPAPDKLLFTPGPLTVSPAVKAAMLRDLGSRDAEFLAIVAGIRQRLLSLGGVAGAGYEAILMQGSGTFGIEAVLSSCIPARGKLLIIINGAYGRRMAAIASRHNIACRELTFPENERFQLAAVEAALASEQGFTHLAVVHSETTTGLINPVAELGRLARRKDLVFIVDAVSSFGGMPLDIAGAGIDFIVSTPNKCIQGVPGFSFVLARREALLATDGCSRTVSLDLVAQWRGLEADGQFRFTPPTHVLLAFQQALDELDAEGGITGRAGRYKKNHDTLIAGMRALGFREYVRPDLQGHILTTFLYPEHPAFEFPGFYRRLSDRGFVIYPGKLTELNCFRIGTIGHLFPADVERLLAAIRSVLGDMGIPVPLKGAAP